MNYVIIILITILCLLVIKNVSRPNDEKFKFDDIDGTLPTIYDNKPLNRSVELKKKKNPRANNLINCRTTIVECDEDSDCLNACAGSSNSRCIEGFCASYDDASFCQNGGIPVSYFNEGDFDYAGCICPETFIGRFCQIENNMLPA